MCTDESFSCTVWGLHLRCCECEIILKIMGGGASTDYHYLLEQSVYSMQKFAVLFLTNSNSPEWGGDLFNQLTPRLSWHLRQQKKEFHRSGAAHWSEQLMTTCVYTMKVTVELQFGFSIFFWRVFVIYPFYNSFGMENHIEGHLRTPHGHTGRWPFYPIQLLITSNRGEKRNVIMEDNKCSWITCFCSSVTTSLNL